ncbi:MAG: carbohydrate-binding protein, partial [Ruminococcus sp.]|nr:carbohydrate-binding protein [Ruminococcus sp.]
DSQNDVGGYPNSTNFKGGSAPADTDHDGMPDEWENAHGLDPNNSSDGSIVSLSPDDYTNVELYLNELAGDTVVIEDSPARSAFDTFEAEDCDSESGTRNQEGEGETHVAYIESGDFIAFKNLDFENGAKSFTANITGNPSGINIFLDAITGEPAASLTFSGSNGWNDWQSISANIPDITGKHTVYLQFTGGEGYLMNIDSFSFGRDYVPLSGKLMTGITAAADAGAPYWKPAFNAAVGSPIFGDRAFTIASLPDTLSGAEQLLTSCGAKAFTGNAAQFTAAEDITLFVALDSRMPEVPEWLGSYSRTGESVTSSNDVTFDLYALNVDKGSEVTLDGNGYSYNVVSYIVFAAERAPETTTSTEVTTTDTTTTTTVTASGNEPYLGDADLSGSISIADVVTVLQYAANHEKYALEPDAFANADVDADGDVTVNDAFIIQQVDANLIPQKDLPVINN